VRITLEGQPALAGALVEPAPELLLAPLAASALRTEHAVGLDLILEGFLLHHGRPRHLAIADDGQRVLAGDFCYAQGLATVAASGDLEVVDALAELVALSSVAVAQGAQEVLPSLWAGTIAVIVAPDGAPAGRFRTARAAFRERGERAPLTALAAELRAPGVEEALGA